MGKMSFPSGDFINRRVDFQFSGVRLKLDLSLGLFSSAGVDAGSLLLLKSIARECALDDLKKVLDAGCGTGVLGLALAGRCPDARVMMEDRDALAAAFAAHNARLNGLVNVQVRHSLMLDDSPDGGFDLILCNFPAKAGDSVLADYLRRSTGLLQDGGRGAVVIVHTLAERCGELIGACGARVIHRDASKGHAVFHYAGGRPGADDGGLGGVERPGGDGECGPRECYIRREGNFGVKGVRYRARTVWNMGDFDTLSWRLELMGGLLRGMSGSGVPREPRESGVSGGPGLAGQGEIMLFWGPGQGHLPMLCCAHPGAEPGRVVLAGRDRLELLISRSNLKALRPDMPIEIHGLADAGLLGGDEVWMDWGRTLGGGGDGGQPGGCGLFVSDLSPVPRSDWAGPLRDAAARLVYPGGIWAILGRSADLAVLARLTKGWTVLMDERCRGWRALVLLRNDGGLQGAGVT